MLICRLEKVKLGKTLVTDKAKVLSISKEILLKEFLIVGILEQFEDTLLALEALLPGYFKGALEVSNEDGMIYLLLLSVNCHFTRQYLFFDY